MLVYALIIIIMISDHLYSFTAVSSDKETIRNSNWTKPLVVSKRTEDLEYK